MPNQIHQTPRTTTIDASRVLPPEKQISPKSLEASGPFGLLCKDVMRCLEARGRTPLQIVERTGYKPQAVKDALASLELDGHVKKITAGNNSHMWRRV